MSTPRERLRKRSYKRVWNASKQPPEGTRLSGPSGRLLVTSSISVKAIGRGGFSIVSKAQVGRNDSGSQADEGCRKRCEHVAATAITRPVYILRQSSTQALEQEIEIWRELRHDHIVPFYGASTLSSPPYIVSRYMKNGNLVQYLSRRPVSNRMKLLYEICLGMRFLHGANVVHGDLKSLNVLVDDSGKACITDFGLSKARSLTPAESNARTIAGTLRFLAPEALRGQPLTFETDVYAFGIVIYEIFAGQTPFMSEPDDVVMEGHLQLKRPTPMEVYERGLDDELWGLLSSCISREPSRRPKFARIQASLQSMKNWNSKGPELSQELDTGEFYIRFAADFVADIFSHATLDGESSHDWNVRTVDEQVLSGIRFR
ncbi:kinase-like domain-containing protein [Melanogaster broomeanus]|nr:kinase-like domain-containing protein [Melanogaster broomeanus]